MARQCYELNLNGEKYKLRLTLRGQKNLLEKRPGQYILAVIMSAADDLEDMEDLLTEALNWEGNSNKIHTGEELYDELVDAGYCGSEDFMKVALNIAKNAGIITQDNRDRLERVVGKAIAAEMDMILSQLEGKQITESEGEENPTEPETPAEEKNLETL